MSVREPAVAGQFYPGSRKRCMQEIAAYMPAAGKTAGWVPNLAGDHRQASPAVVSRIRKSKASRTGARRGLISFSRTQSSSYWRKRPTSWMYLVLPGTGKINPMRKLIR